MDPDQREHRAGLGLGLRGRAEGGGEEGGNSPNPAGRLFCLDCLYRAGSTLRVGVSRLRTLDNKTPSCQTNALCPASQTSGTETVVSYFTNLSHRLWECCRFGGVTHGLMCDVCVKKKRDIIDMNNLIGVCPVY